MKLLSVAELENIRGGKDREEFFDHWDSSIGFLLATNSGLTAVMGTSCLVGSITKFIKEKKFGILGFFSTVFLSIATACGIGSGILLSSRGKNDKFSNY